MEVKGRPYATILSAYLASENGTEGVAPGRIVDIEGEGGGESSWQGISGRRSGEQSIRWGSRYLKRWSID